ncbi:PEP/pyruvate-binding domain-containing protein [Vibrio mangrovi]|uniref:PEP/pyruvate-binding domain-containing protein n=1 Tax=Vibrio mangrovi TaxID=474394 RepID=A0A1Y6ISG5_9VIBR|nr:PEP/pyruvate-binding domain-containing protein [Vibrio mangrovi]MDW6004190.1 PEP/pyruvate-binding domain-containing protein [Vibrio mangrovi]SMR99013.1 Phosphoenolpyruvate synthase [Vibrio mangrovi]
MANTKSTTTQLPMIVRWDDPDFAQSDYLSDLPGILGGKGASLWVLMNQMKMPVPEFCCVTAGAFVETLKQNGLHDLVAWLNHPEQPLPMDNDQIRSSIFACEIASEIIDELVAFRSQYPDSHFAVRSSGTVEDGAEASFAGLFQSVLNVQKTADIIEAVKTCWYSLFNERVQTYMAKQHTVGSLGMALVVQRLIPAEKSGVLFTADPIQGIDTEMLIEATFGLGEALVSGAVTPDLYRYNWYQEAESERTISTKEQRCVRISAAPFVQLEALDDALASQQVLSTQEVTELAGFGLSIQTQSGFPVDIEWAQENGRFYILQSRPITQFGYSAIAGEWTTADYRDGGVSAMVCTPYMASLYKFIMDSTMGSYLQGLQLTKKPASVWQKSFFGRPYWNLGEFKQCMAKMPGFNERAFDESLGISPNYQGNGIVTKTTLKSLLVGIRTLLNIKANVKRKLRESPIFSKQQHQRLEELAAMDLTALPDQELFRFYESFIRQEYFNSESTYFNFIYDNVNLNSIFKDEVEKTSFDMGQFPFLLSGLSGVSHMAPIENLWQLRDKIQQDSQAQHYWLNHSSATIAAELNQGSTQHYLTEVAQYLEEFGHHSKQELDLLVPRYIEIPESIIEQLQTVLRQDADKDPRVRNEDQQSKNKAVMQMLIQSTPLLKRRSLTRMLGQVRELLWWREELRDLSVRYYRYVRKITLEVENRLLQAGVLQQKDDVFFLEMSDVIAAVQGKLSAGQVSEKVQKNRAYYASFSRYQIADEIGERYGMFGAMASNTDNLLADSSSSDEPENSIKGVAGSPGVITGIARVVVDINDADRLQPEDILITRCTDPGWTPKFSMLSGVVTETGGILSHAAVICREYGIPAVLAVKQATRKVRDGDVITIDGSQGRIILQHQPAPKSSAVTSVDTSQLEVSRSGAL